jgi:hypothetical protein
LKGVGVGQGRVGEGGLVNRLLQQTVQPGDDGLELRRGQKHGQIVRIAVAVTSIM